MDSLELFCGTGGLALGLQSAGFHHTDLYEWDKDSCDNINYNIHNGYDAIRDWRIHNVDVRDVDYSPFEDRIQVVAGGPRASRSHWVVNMPPIKISEICSQRRFELYGK